MEASSWPLVVRTSERENQEAQIGSQGSKQSRLRGDKILEVLQRPTFQPTSVPPSGRRRQDSLFGPTFRGPWRAAGAMLAGLGYPLALESIT